MSKTYLNTLPLPYQLKNYRIDNVLNIGDFNIVYLAYDLEFNRKVVIKEFFPEPIAIRNSNKLFIRDRGDKEIFVKGLQFFFKNYAEIHQLNHPSIDAVYDVFRANNTGYSVVKYEQGRTLQEALEESKMVTEDELKTLLPLILEALEQLFPPYNHKIYKVIPLKAESLQLLSHKTNQLSSANWTDRIF